MYHCLFEQSGTFKNEFIKLGGVAKDYDILNDYGETDVVCDLYQDIEKAFYGLNGTIFDKIKKDDFVIAFFPCTRFEDQVLLAFRGDAFQMKKWTDEYKLQYDLYLHEELSRNYSVVTKLVLICKKIGVPLVIENPYSEQHYLRRYWPIKPAIVDLNRRLNGDYMKKPTQYFFVNCEPKNNLVMEVLEEVPVRKMKGVKRNGTWKCKENEGVVILGKDRQKVRSEIHPQYASRFIKQYIATQNEDLSFIV